MTLPTIRCSIARWLAASLCIAMLGLGSAAPALAQVKARAYAPERVWELSTSEQRRVIDLEYSEQSGGRRIPEEQMRFYLDQIRLSNWPFSRIRRDIADSLAGSGWGGQPQDQNNIRCESPDNRSRTCATPWQGGSRLARQLSGTPCVEGQNWWSSNGQVQVNGGCRAEFAPAFNAPTPGGEIRCESPDNRSRTCATPWQGGSRLVRQLSGTPCVEGQNWWSSNGQVQVNGGCRAEFAPAFNAPTSGGEIRCESPDNRSRTCATPWQGGSRLVRQLSGTPCVEGQNWWSSYGEVQVTGGCRAEFAAALNTPAQGGEIRCESTDGRTRACPTPWPGASELSYQLSSTPCIAGQNWSSSRGEVRVSGGCRAVFVQASYGSGQGEEIRCESADGRYRECRTGLRGRATLVRQLSSTTCTEGVNWGVRNGTLWVNGGCRAVFQLAGSGWNEAYSVTCASDNGRHTTCAWDRNRGLPRLLETLSQARCTEGYSWGYDLRGGLWVNYGCRARFGVR